METDTYYCDNCEEFVNNVSETGRITCLECGNPVDKEGNR